MALEAANVKNATKIRLYCHLAGYMDGDLKPLPVTKDIEIISQSSFENIYLTNFLEYNKVTLANKDQQFTVADSVIACKIPEYCGFINDLGFAFKSFLPPHMEKLEFLDADGEVIYTKHFSSYNEENVLVAPDKTYSKWFIYSISEKILLGEETLPKETYCFEYQLHTADTNAHAKDIVSLPMQLDNRSLAQKDSIYYALYDTEKEADTIEAKSQVINGNLVTNNYRLFYLGNNIYDNTDEINKVADWAEDQRNIDQVSSVFEGSCYTPAAFISMTKEVWLGSLDAKLLVGNIYANAQTHGVQFINLNGKIDALAPNDNGSSLLSVPSWGGITSYLIGNGTFSTSQTIEVPSWSRSGTAYILSAYDYDNYNIFADISSTSINEFKTVFTDANGNNLELAASSITVGTNTSYIYFNFNFTDSPFGEIRFNISHQYADVYYRLTLASAFRPNTDFPTNSTFGSTYWNSDLTLKQNCKISLIRKRP